MLGKIVVLTLLGAIPATHARSSSSFQIPTPGLVESLNRHHHRHDWLRITTDSARYEARVREFGAQGLNGVTSRRGPDAPDFIPWSSVMRLDQTRSGFRAGQIVGAVALGSLGVPTMLSGEPEVAGFVALGAVVGMGFGGLVGSHWSREVPLYAASPASESGAVTTNPDGEPVHATSSSPDALLAGSAAGDPRRAASIERMKRILRPGRRLRIRSEFGEFDGYIDQAGAGGLEGLRSLRRGTWGAPSPRHLDWESIATIDRRGNSAGWGAVHLAVPLASAGFAIGLAVGGAVSDGSNSGSAVLAGGALGAAVAGSFGAVLGALFGSVIPRWHRVYTAAAEVPPPSDRTSR